MTNSLQDLSHLVPSAGPSAEAVQTRSPMQNASRGQQNCNRSTNRFLLLCAKAREVHSRRSQPILLFTLGLGSNRPLTASQNKGWRHHHCSLGLVRSQGQKCACSLALTKYFQTLQLLFSPFADALWFCLQTIGLRNSCIAVRWTVALLEPHKKDQSFYDSHWIKLQFLKQCYFGSKKKSYLPQLLVQTTYLPI